ncbi:hypothetical protein FH609_024785 [Streptomyces sp. 3MP-14]|uniref:SUKH-4 immunity protein of toxin-antitoxin system n=1 Tax=Streptomyces mimosae TaxID=2586635 RepID=A0A5N6A229_9ACTN|nr:MULTISPECIES: nucleic acid/nucleotide deaminase domain-containing protein [Streptomyces]KAB8162163.1 hypothetical protein FH607_021950 [Streptomyces mimosae]KAB8173939.1 hypothetical protein FH609_024785 [Streptomyces sp. 3MP-14]
MSTGEEDLPGRLMARFGREGLRRIAVPEGTASPADSVLLTEVGVPRQVGPYFTSAADAPAQLGPFCASIGVAAPDAAKARWCRLGGDRGAQLCLDEHGTVRAEFIDVNEPGQVVNVSLTAFLESLLALDEGISSLASTESIEERAELVRALIRRLAVADSEPTESPDSWWLMVLQDIRHTMTHPGYTAFEIEDPGGQKQVVTSAGGFCLHPEERLWGELEASGVRPEQVTRIYTELEACFLPGHYCSLWLAEVFPEARFSHSFPYQGNADEREAGFLAMMHETAALGRQGKRP